MKITFLFIGKTEDNNLQNLIQLYTERLKHYIKIDFTEVLITRNKKGIHKNHIIELEANAMLKYFKNADKIVLLDENGTEFTSIGFANELQKLMNSGIKNLMFVVGGAFGFSEEIYKTVNTKISISKMTFSHQMIRLLFVEQLYRAFTILNNEPYHNE